MWCAHCTHDTAFGVDQADTNESLMRHRGAQCHPREWSALTTRAPGLTNETGQIKLDLQDTHAQLREIHLSNKGITERAHWRLLPRRVVAGVPLEGSAARRAKRLT